MIPFNTYAFDSGNRLSKNIPCEHIYTTKSIVDYRLLRIANQPPYREPITENISCAIRISNPINLVDNPKSIRYNGKIDNNACSPSLYEMMNKSIQVAPSV